MMGRLAGQRLYSYIPDYTVFDLETTGLSTRKDKIIEISALRCRNGQIVAEFSSLVNPEEEIPDEASWVNHITDDMVKDQPTIGEVLPKFLEFIGKDALVGHNIKRFDLQLIQRDCKNYLGIELPNPYFDTLPVSQTYLPDLCSHSLVDLVSYYRMDTEGAHRALNDCRMNQFLYEKLAEEMQHPGPNVKLAPACPKCGSPMVLREGRFGSFYGCSNYPDCRGTRNA